MGMFDSRLISRLISSGTRGLTARGYSSDRESCSGREAEEEVANVMPDDVNDGRITPEYDFVYKQAVETTDTYLGMDPMGKDPTSTSCEDVVLCITLPEADSAADIDVDLKPTWIIVRTATQCALAP